jgi:hypothetical protein
MILWFLYLGVITLHIIMGGTVNEVLGGILINNAFLLFGPVHYFNTPQIEAWIDSNRLGLAAILSLILAYYIIKVMNLLKIK